MNVHRAQLTELALRHRLPSISGSAGYTKAGGLMSFGQQFGYNYVRVASYVDKIFRGAKPGDLPVEQPVEFDLVVNEITARAIGVTFPKEVLLRATVVG